MVGIPFVRPPPAVRPTREDLDRYVRSEYGDGESSWLAIPAARADVDACDLPNCPPPQPSLARRVARAFASLLF